MNPLLAKYVNPYVVNNKNSKTIDGVKLRRGDVSISSHVEHRTVIIDVRHCSIRTPTRAGETGLTIEAGEKEKIDFYRKHFRFPQGMVMVPFVVDSYGKWGPCAKEWLESACKRAAGEDKKLYNQLITRSRETISVAHARGVGRVIERCVESCFSPGGECRNQRDGGG